MPASLFVEHHPHGIAFYINGNLQFDTADEAIYHEYLVVPAIALAVQRFPDTPLRVLICGGGDGLAARDVLRFAAVTDLTLVDYSPEVLELGRTTFKPYNRGSLSGDRQATLGASRVTVYTQEAFEFVSQLPNACFHVVICDFTSPTRSEETQVYSREWFTQLERILYPTGLLAVNAVSPEITPTAFWCLYQTLFAAGLQPRPMQIPIPSFQRHDYGDWGFFLASSQPIQRAEVKSLHFPTGLQALKSPTWLDAFKLKAEIAHQRHQVKIHTLEYPQLFYYLLNPQTAEKLALDTTELEATIDFLDLQETGTIAISTQDLLQLDTLVKHWLAQAQTLENSETTQLNLEELVPVQHYYHNPRMVTESLSHLRWLLAEIDLEKLLPNLLERAKSLPPKLTQDLQQLVEKIRSGEPLTQSTQIIELITILSVTLVVANLTTPDIVFAKGYSGFRSGSGSGSRSSGGSSYNDGYYAGDYGENRFGWIGFCMMLGGGFWLKALLRDRSQDES